MICKCPGLIEQMFMEEKAMSDQCLGKVAEGQRLGMLREAGGGLPGAAHEVQWEATVAGSRVSAVEMEETNWFCNRCMKCVFPILSRTRCP